MQQNREFNLFLTFYDKVIIIIGFIAPIAVGIIIYFDLFKGTGSDGPPAFFFGFIPIAILSFYLFWTLSIPYKIIVMPNDLVIFNSVIRKKKMQLNNIKSIMPYGGHRGIFVVKTDYGKVNIINQFDGFHEFIIILKNRNPAVELRGC